MFGALLDLFTGSSGLVWTLLVLIMVYYLFNRHTRLKSLPPGPTPLPLLGNVLNLAGSTDQLETFGKLRGKYGDLVTLHVGSFTMIVVSGYDTLRELFIKHGDVTSDRPDLFIFRDIAKGEVSQLMNTIADMFIAGMETTTTTLLWAILFFLNNPDVQERCHEEVMKVVGEGRFPSLADRPQMPYIEATITEILRCGNIAPLGVPHATSQDVMFRGHIIPKGTMLLANINSVHSDPQLFPDPGKFNPSRFIDSDGKIHGTEHVISFFFGRRVCMGESLARSELFLFLTSMVQRFQFKPVDPNNIPPVKGNLAATLKPCAYECVAEKRD